MRDDHPLPRGHVRLPAGRRLLDAIVGLLALGLGGGLAAERTAAPHPTLVKRVHFDRCGGGRRINCVVDGDTFWIGGEKIRIADIDTPETHPARCASEAALGARATVRLQALLNGGRVTMTIGARDMDRYGRKLRIVSRGGVSFGDTLVREGLAREWTGRRMSWCV